MDTEALTQEMTTRLSGVKGVRAIVLGGSRAAGTHTAASDIDIGLYYEGEDSLDVTALQKAAEELDDHPRKGLVTPIGEWGPWVNGGGWLKVQGQAVDWLYRDAARVDAVLEDGLAGTITIEYYPGHPHGFVNSIYLAEVALCRVLWDPEGLIAGWKRKTREYSAVFQQATIRKFQWEASFSLRLATKGVDKGDLSYVAGCCFRAVSCLNQVLFALNKRYCMNEKGAVPLADTFPRKPADYRRRVESIYGLLSEDAGACREALDRLGGLIRETEALG
ncbi:nucleotidyltransferase domain-containing protein [Paenibacillus sp. CC-CFT747]|nr:nucleotidyltransferase domain-containing protein [Paenibacillus sp. CC-CFT747]